MLFKTATAPLGKEHLAIFSAVKLSFPSSVQDPVPHIRAAWAATRKHHPHLGSVLNKDSLSDETGEVRPILIPQFNAEEWLRDTFAVETQAANASALFASAKDEEYATCTWIPASSEVLFQTSHWRMDGGSIMTIAVNFLHVLSQSLAKGTDASIDAFTSPLGDGRMASNVDWILDSFLDDASTPEYMKKAADTMFADMMAGAPSVALPPRSGSDDAVPGDSLRSSLDFGVETTGKLLAKCKEKGITLTLATHAAIVLCSAKYPQHPLCKSYGRFSPVDIRKEFPAPYNTPQYSLGEYCAAFPVIVLDVAGEGNGKTFDQACEELKKSYKGAKNLGFVDDAGKPVSTAELGAPFIRKIIELVNTKPPEGMPTVQAVDFASMGLVEKVMDREYPIEGKSENIVVENFWLNTQTIVKGVQCHGWTFRDEYVLTATYNKSYYDSPYIEDFLGKVKDQLVQGLNI